MDVLIKYEKEKAANKIAKKILRDKIKKETTRQHLKYIKTKKGMVLFLDIMFILAIFNNIGAALVTDYLVVKVAGGGVFYEANPYQCGEKTGWACADDVVPPDKPKSNIYHIIISQLGIYMLFFGWYLHQRSKVKDYSTLVGLFFVVGIVFLGLTYDFAHDIALLMGTWTW